MAKTPFKQCLFLYLALLAYVDSYATGRGAVQNLNTYNKDWSFVENKGQLADCVGNLIKDVKFYSRSGIASLYCRPGMISFIFMKVENQPDQISEATGQQIFDTEVQNSEHLHRKLNTQVETNRIDLLLLNSNLSAPILASDQQEYYENFYLAHTPESGITNVHTFKSIVYKNVYPHIDMILHARENGLKYEFVINPGGKVSDIKLQWNGLKKIALAENGGISYTFGLGNMNESKPCTYQNGKEITSSFTRKGNKIGFKTGDYHKDKVLVIDPLLDWSTYFGKMGYEDAFLANDSSGNLYITGQTRSLSGMATAGAYQTSYGGGQMDVYIAKFDGNGQLKWATYYGGNGYDYSQTIACDGFGSLFIAGWTWSHAGIATKGCYQSLFGGGSTDGMLAKFSTDGLLTWATYFGGERDDGALGVTCDASGNVFICGQTTSSSNIATSGAYQTSFASTQIFLLDAFLAKFNSGGTILWSTYYGGEKHDNAWGVCTDGAGNVYMTGITESNTRIASTGAYQTFLNGVNDAFVAKFDQNGVRQWATYFGGIEGDAGGRVAADSSGNLYLIGSTYSKTNLATTGAFQTNLGGNNDAFLAKFNASGKRIWATYYGGADNDYSGGDISIGRNGDILFAGQTKSLTGLATAGAYQTSNAGGYDAFFVEFNSTGARQWGTYYGGTADDVGTSATFDRYGNLYFVGYTFSSSGISNKNGYQPVYGGGCDAFLAKFGNEPAYDTGIDSFISPSGTSCQGLFSVIVRLKNYGLEPLNSVMIHLSLNGKIQKSFKWTGLLKPDSTVLINMGKVLFQTGTDTLRSWTNLPNGTVDQISYNDLSVRIINVLPLPKANAGPDITLCYNQTYTMQGSGGTYYLWTPAKYLDNDTIAHPKATLPNTQLYILYVTDKQGCKDSAKVLLSVKLKPKADFNILNLKPYSTDSAIRFNNLSKNAKGYRWNFGDLKSSSLFNPLHQYTDSGNFKITLTAIGEGSCPGDTISKYIKIISNGIHIYIPNVFTPTGDNLNELFEIKGSGIKSYSYNIYNRWGEPIFQSSHTKPAWDGTFKNQPVMEGVFLYQMDVTDIDGIHHYLSGTVTLVR